MNFADTWETNKHGEKFIFTVEMKRKLAKAGLPIEVEALQDLDQTPSTAPPSATTPAQQAPPPAPSEPEMIQIDPETGKYIGSLKWYNASRGYGFISRGAGEDIFFHKTSTIGNPEEIAEGQSVLYDVEERNKGPEATEVEPYDG